MTAQFPKVVVSVLNWNGPTKTIRCLESLKQLTYPNVHLLVVDNASVDDSVQQIQTAFPGVDLLRSSENLGYAGGHRLALERARQDGADLLWILNNDTVVQPDTLTALVDAYHRQGEGLYGSMPLDGADDPHILFTVWATGSDGRLRFWFEQAVRRGDPYREWEHRAECRVANISGSSFMVPVAVTRKFGFMDESFFMYAEEVDYCFRLGSAGVPCFLVPSSIVLHDATATVQLHPQLDAVIKYYRMRNWLRMIRKYAGYRAYWSEMNAVLHRNACIKRWIKGYFSAARMAKTAPVHYYTCLGVWHSLINRQGKTLAPESFLE